MLNFFNINNIKFVYTWYIYYFNLYNYYYCFFIYGDLIKEFNKEDFDKNKLKKIKFITLLDLFYTNIRLFSIFSINIFFKNFFSILLTTLLFLTATWLIFFIISLKIFFLNFFFYSFLLISIIYLLMTGFVFFFKKSQFSKYTNNNSRFWIRAYIVFWLLEIFLFFVFLYLTINSNSEPISGYDTSSIIEECYTFFNAYFFFLISIFIIIFVHKYLNLTARYTNNGTNSLIYILFTFFFNLVFFWFEFYTFLYYISNFQGVTYVFDSEINEWIPEIQTIRNKIIFNFFFICILLKFFHLLFILIFSFFSIIRFSERLKISYTLVIFNKQNYMILLVMSFLQLFFFLKNLIIGYSYLIYFWFLDNDEFLSIILFYTETLNIFNSYITSIYDFFHCKKRFVYGLFVFNY